MSNYYINIVNLTTNGLLIILFVENVYDWMGSIGKRGDVCRDILLYDRTSGYLWLLKRSKARQTVQFIAVLSPSVSQVSKV